MKEFNLTTQSEIAEDFLQTYGYGSASSNVIEHEIFNEWYGKKSMIRETLRRHPNWNEEAQAVVFNEDYECGIDSGAIRDFFCWCSATLRTMESYVSVDEQAKYHYYDVMHTNYYDARHGLSSISEMCSVRETEEFKTLYKNVCDLYKMYGKMWKEYDEKYWTINGKLVSEKRYNAYNFFSRFDTKTLQTLTDEEFVEEVIDYFPDIKGIVAGMKTSKAIGKICKYLGLDTIKDLKNKVNPETGEVTQKDYGYNYQFAMCADAINPLKVSAITVISINPFDYWTMSFGTSWASCHTIDKENYDRRSNTYQGQYSAGTESYMLDDSSIVFYTIKPEYKGETEFTSEEEMSDILKNRTELWRVPKSRRMMFHLADDGNGFVYGRLYPDARDGGDTGLAAQFRNTFQKVISDCQNAPNLWVVNKGTVGSDVVDSNGHHYRDYLSYGDCGYCYRKDTPKKIVYIGHNAICPECGQWHDKEDNILCWDCSEDYFATCAECGDHIMEGDDECIYCADTDEYYCCESCAERADVHWCDNAYEYHHIDYCFWDDWNDEWVYGEPDVVTEDGYKYRSSDDAIEAGYYFDGERGEWYKVDQMTMDAYDECYYSNYYHDWIEVDGKFYHNRESAEADGNVYDEENDEWRAA